MAWNDETFTYETDPESSYVSGDSGGWDWTGVSDMFGANDFAPDYAGDYANPSFDLGSQLADAGLIPYTDYGMPDISYLMDPQFQGATDLGALGDLSQYAALGGVPTDADQVALQEANLRGAGYDPITGNSNEVIDPTTGKLINISDIGSNSSEVEDMMRKFNSLNGSVQGIDPTQNYAKISGVDGINGLGSLAPSSKEPSIDEFINSEQDSAMAAQRAAMQQGQGQSDSTNLEAYYRAMDKPQMSVRNTAMNDLLARDAYGQSSVDAEGNVIASRGPYSAIYDPESPTSFEDAYSQIERMAAPGTDTTDPRNILQKGVGALSQMLRGNSASSANPQGGSRTSQGGQGGGTGSSAKSLAEMLMLAAGAFQKNGKAPAPTGANPGASSWQVSRKAGSGRKNKAEGGAIEGRGATRGALGLLAGRSKGQSDIVPINAAHGEYVMDADIVSALGDGNTEAGAAKLDEMRHNIRKHKRSASADKIPPKAKSPLAYLAGAR